ncbi:MAG: tRNA pseudouridine synthase [Planctomycetota bacterium]
MSEHVPDPLLAVRLLEWPPLGGRIKSRPEDFLVDETPLVEPSGQGEHLHMGIQKSGLSHDDMVDAVARHCGVPVHAVGHAGMKDRVAITRQTISVHLPGLPDPPVIQHPNLQVLWARRHQAKLRPGQLRGNRFSIRIRGCDPLRAPQVRRGLEALTRRGCPNAFGRQRFGHRLNGHRLGMLLAQEQWQALLDELLGSHGSPFPPSQQYARARYDAGDMSSSLSAWSRPDRAERAAVRALAGGRSPRQAVMAIPRHTRQFWVHAAQSAAFNRVLGHRMRLGLFDRFVPGDLAILHPGRSLFRVGTADLSEGGRSLDERLLSFDCSPTGPMPGAEVMPAEDACAELERAALEPFGHGATHLAATGEPGERRSLRMRVTDPQVESGVDEHGPYIRVAFDLPRGGYATSVLAEVMGDEPDSGAESPASSSDAQRAGTHEQGH